MEERKIKIGWFWLTKEILDSFISMLKVQETTDKLCPGDYTVYEHGYVIEYKIDDEYDIILESVYYEER